MQIHNIIEKYINSDSNTRQQIEKEVGLSDLTLGSLLGFMSDCAVNSVRQNNSSFISQGLYSNVIEGCRQDFRDNITDLTKLYHSCIILGLNPDVEFKKVADDTTGEGKDLIVKFIKRQPSDKTLKCMGYKTVYTPEFDFVWDGFNSEYLHGTEYSEETDKKIMNGWH
jgi:hypothetical protein